MPSIYSPTCPEKPNHTQRATCLVSIHLHARKSPITRRGPHAQYSFTYVPGKARSQVEGHVPSIYSPTCLDKPSHMWRATCLVFIHLRARTSRVTRRGPHAQYSLTHVPRLKWKATCLQFIHLRAPSHVEGYVPSIHSPTCLDKPSHTYRAMCLVFIHLCDRTSTVTHRGLHAYKSFTYVPEQHVEGLVPRSHLTVCVDKHGHHVEGHMPRKSFTYVPGQAWSSRGGPRAQKSFT